MMFMALGRCKTSRLRLFATPLASALKAKPNLRTVRLLAKLTLRVHRQLYFPCRACVRNERGRDRSFKDGQAVGARNRAKNSDEAHGEEDPMQPLDQSERRLGINLCSGPQYSM
jgi:hypothetical protein